MKNKNAEKEDLARCDIGIVCALPIELSAFMDRCEKVNKYSGGEFVFRGGRYDKIRIALVESGMGFARARRATQSLIEAHAPAWIISAGYSGALQPEIKLGDIVIGTSIVDTHGHELKIDMNMPADPEKGLHVGRLVTADKLVRKADEKSQLAEQYKALAVDLESLAVAQVSRENKTPFMAVRVISDDRATELPPEILSVVGATGSVRWGAAIGAVWKRPGSVKEMWQLRELAQKSSEKLASFLDGIVHQLYQSKH